MDIRTDCFHFRGHVPCTPHKERGVHCEDCPEYRKRAGRILLIKGFVVARLACLGSGVATLGEDETEPGAYVPRWVGSEATEGDDAPAEQRGESSESGEEPGETTR